jgi:hypothetical protein
MTTITLCTLTLMSLGLEGISFLKYGHDLVSLAAIIFWITEIFGFGYALQMWIVFPKTWIGLHTIIGFQPMFLIFLVMTFFSTTTTALLQDIVIKDNLQ